MSITLEQFGGKADGRTPNDQAMAAAIDASITKANITGQQRILLGPGVYLFEQPITFIPRLDYWPAPQLIGVGGLYNHMGFWSTTLKFTHTDERPCIRLAGKAAHLQDLGVAGPAKSYCAVELGNDCWPGRADEPGFKGDAVCTRSLIRNVATWGCRIGFSVRGWVHLLENCKPLQCTDVGIRLAGNAMTVRDCYYAMGSGLGIHIEHGQNINIIGGAIEASRGWAVEGKIPRFRSLGAIKIDGCDSCIIDGVYMEGHPYAVSADDVHGLWVRGINSGAVSPPNHSYLADRNEFSRGCLVEITEKTRNYHLEFGRMRYGVKELWTPESVAQ